MIMQVLGRATSRPCKTCMEMKQTRQNYKETNNISWPALNIGPSLFLRLAQRRRNRQSARVRKKKIKHCTLHYIIPLVFVCHAAALRRANPSPDLIASSDEWVVIQRCDDTRHKNVSEVEQVLRTSPDVNRVNGEGPQREEATTPSRSRHTWHPTFCTPPMR